AQLAYLKQQGFTAISLSDLIYHLAGHKDLPPKPVIITFDDGYADNYANAFPLLQKYGFTATFALVTQPIDFGDPRYMSWANVTEMHTAGMEFAAHSYRHYDLRDQTVDFLVYEILGSKEAIEARIGEPVRFFVYPSGQYDAQTIAVVASANFWGALTTHYGDEHTYRHRFEIVRVRVRGADTLADFAAKLP
ncbi:MAG: polysaccharide deacetylase family protein, partial [Anaerolineae bacterium]